MAACSGLVGHSCLSVALKKANAVAVGVVLNLEPVATAVYSAVLVGQVLQLGQYIGATIVVISVAYYGYSRTRIEAR